MLDKFQIRTYLLSNCLPYQQKKKQLQKKENEGEREIYVLERKILRTKIRCVDEN